MPTYPHEPSVMQQKELYYANQIDLLYPAQNGIIWARIGSFSKPNHRHKYHQGNQSGPRILNIERSSRDNNTPKLQNRAKANEPNPNHSNPSRKKTQEPEALAMPTPSFSILSGSLSQKASNVIQLVFEHSLNTLILRFNLSLKLMRLD